jgi:hypothetical protein
MKKNHWLVIPLSLLLSAGYSFFLHWLAAHAFMILWCMQVLFWLIVPLGAVVLTVRKKCSG